MASDNKGIPVFTYEEVAGLVLGYNPWDIGTSAASGRL